MKLGLCVALGWMLMGCGGIATGRVGGSDASSTPDAVDGATSFDAGSPLLEAGGAVGTVVCPVGLEDGGPLPPGSSVVHYDKHCAVASDCAMGTQYLDCCGSVIVLGINVDEVPIFDSNTGICHYQPACDCASQLAIAEDGRRSNDQLHWPDVAVFCVGGACVTRIVRDGP
jgi:hypothetical protein